MRLIENNVRNAIVYFLCGEHHHLLLHLIGGYTQFIEALIVVALLQRHRIYTKPSKLYVFLWDKTHSVV